jgi:hypothetical protein
MEWRRMSSCMEQILVRMIDGMTENRGMDSHERLWAVARQAMV